MPDWQPIVNTYLARFPTITSADVDRTEHWASNASMFYATGSWRAKVVRGELFVKFIRAHSHWAERASVLRIVMLALDGLRREGVSLPDFEFVYAHNDKDPTPDSFPKCHPTRRRRRGKTRGAEPSEPPCVGAPIPLFTNGRAVRHGDGAIGAGGLPLPDFTWVGWREQLPWCQLSAQLQSEAARHGQWSGRDARAIFSGGLDNGRDRKELRRLVRQRSVEAQRLSHTCTAPRASPAAWLLGPGPPCVGGIADRWARLYREQERRATAAQPAFPQPAFPWACRRGSCCACATRRQASGTGGRSSTAPTAQAQSPRSGRRCRSRARVHTASPYRSRASATRPGCARFSCAARPWCTCAARTRSSSCPRWCRLGLGLALTLTLTLVRVSPNPNPNPNPNQVPGQHLLVLEGKDAVGEQLLPALEALQRDSARAARIAAAGQRFAQEWLSFGSVVRYVQTLLRSYAARYRGAVALPSADDARVRSAADVRRLARLCDCSGGRAEQSAKSCLAAVPSSWRCGRMARVALLAAAHVATHGSRERKG